MFSSWSALLEGVLQCSDLRPILLDIFLNDLFFILQDTDVCNFADNHSPHTCDINLDELLKHLERDSALAICWFENKVKTCVHYFLSNFYFSPNDSPSKTMKNVFYFI